MKNIVLFFLVTGVFGCSTVQVPRPQAPNSPSAPIFDLPVSFESRLEMRKNLKVKKLKLAKSAAFKEMSNVSICVSKERKEVEPALPTCPEQWPQYFAGFFLLGGKTNQTLGQTHTFLFFGGETLSDPKLIGIWENETLLMAFRLVPYEWPTTIGKETQKLPTILLKDIQRTSEILYLSFSHDHSAIKTNASITAYHLLDKEVLWRSRPLTANSENFVITENKIYSGYGMPNEKGFIYSLDRNSGQELEKIEIPSPARVFAIEEDKNTLKKLQVRTQIGDLVFEN